MCLSANIGTLLLWSCVETFESRVTALCFAPQWHALTREEQAKYYELARKERQLHMQLYPSWSARDNYVSDPAPNTHTHAQTHTQTHTLTPY